MGASGFIGRWVASLLQKAGAELYLPARDCAAARTTFAEYGIRGSLLKLDLSDSDVLHRLIEEVNPAIVFNLAGYGIDRTEVSEELALEINARLPKNICRALSKIAPAADWSGQRFVHVGTAMEYGDVDGDLSEESETCPSTVYGRSKLAGTEGVTEACRASSLAGITARLFAVYGPGESTYRLLPSLIGAASRAERVELTAGLHRRDFTYVEDIAEALLRLGVADCAAGEVVNVATGSLTTVRSFVETAAECLGLDKSRLDFGALPTRPEEMHHDPVNTNKLLKLTGWRPETRPLEGIRRTLSFMRWDKGVQMTTRLRESVCELF